MNTSNVVSVNAAGDLRNKEYHVLKLTSTGVDLATSSDAAILVGTLLRAMPTQEDGVYLGKSCGVMLLPGSVHFVTIGASSAAVAIGAGLILDSANPGKLVPSESSPIARAWEAFTGASGAVVRAVFI